MVTLTCPNSSSRVKKRIFLAVDGAWRVMTSPATRTRVLFGIFGTLSVSRAPMARSRSRQKWMRWWPVDRSEMRYSSWLMSNSSTSGKAGEVPPRASSVCLSMPRRRPLPCHRFCPPHVSSRPDRPAPQPGEEIVEGAIGTVRCALFDDGLASFLAQIADVVEADAQGVFVVNRLG